MKSMLNRQAPYWFLAPFLISFVLFSAYPIARSLILSTYITSGPESMHFIGLQNFRYLLSDADFWLALKNTVMYAVGNILLQIPVSLGIALLLNRPDLRARNFFRFVFFSPHLMGMVFSAILFTLLLAPRFGLINQFLHTTLGTPLDIRWLNEPGLVMPSLILISIWLYAGFNMVYFLAALQSVDENLYEAARIDGANAWQQFIHVTLPGIRPVLVFVVVLTTIGSLQMFELAYLLLGNGSGPNQSGLTLVMYLYENGFVGGDLGYASAVGWTLTLIILAFSLCQIWLNQARD